LDDVPELISTPALSYAEDHTTPFAGSLASVAAWTQGNMESPEMMSGLAEARLLEALIVAGRARRVLEIGTFTGLGGLVMAGALPPDGRVITLEADEETAAIARRHIDTSPVGDRMELIVGDALETLTRLDGPFDLVYIDAWKSDYPAYYEAVLPKLSEHGVIVADNLFRRGLALTTEADDPHTLGIREFARKVQSDERVHNVLLTIGDGMMLVWWRPARSE
jgi:caffeoyl-CoA O-methyltransferase